MNADPTINTDPWDNISPDDPAWQTGSAAPHEQPDETLKISEGDVAIAMARKYKNRLFFAPHIGAWYIWNGTTWEIDTKDVVHYLIHKCARDLANTIAAKNATKIKAASNGFAAGSLRLFRSFPGFQAVQTDLDPDPWLLGTPAGTVDLRTSELRTPDPNDYITQSTSHAPAPPDTPCPIWRKHIDWVTRGDAQLARNLQQIIGYCLTGLTVEHAMFFLYGSGRNGKGVLVNTIFKLMGGYAKTADMQTFTDTPTPQHLAFLAVLAQARLVTGSETEAGRAWAESKIKAFTGADPLIANFMRTNPFEFIPKFKILILGNNQPVIKNVDEAIKRRINIIPFLNQISVEDRDMFLEERMEEEKPAILRWAIDGCLDWQANGLMRAQSVTDATQGYFDEQELVKVWIAEKCKTGPRHEDAPSALYDSWSKWALAAGERPMSQRWFSQSLVRYGYELWRSNGRRKFLGIAAHRDAPRPHNEKAEGDY